MNKMCIPVPHPEYPEDYAHTFLNSLLNADMLARKGPGVSWLRSSRLSPFYHMSVSGIIKFIVFDYKYKNIYMKKLEMLCKVNTD